MAGVLFVSMLIVLHVVVQALSFVLFELDLSSKLSVMFLLTLYSLLAVWFLLNSIKMLGGPSSMAVIPAAGAQWMYLLLIGAVVLQVILRTYSASSGGIAGLEAGHYSGVLPDWIMYALFPSNPVIVLAAFCAFAGTRNGWNLRGITIAIVILLFVVIFLSRSRATLLYLVSAFTIASSLGRSAGNISPRMLIIGSFLVLLLGIGSKMVIRSAGDVDVGNIVSDLGGRFLHGYIFEQMNYIGYFQEPNIRCFLVEVFSLNSADCRFVLLHGNALGHFLNMVGSTDDFTGIHIPLAIDLISLFGFAAAPLGLILFFVMVAGLLRLCPSNLGRRFYFCGVASLLPLVLDNQLYAAMVAVLSAFLFAIAIGLLIQVIRWLSPKYQIPAPRSQVDGQSSAESR